MVKRDPNFESNFLQVRLSEVLDAVDRFLSGQFGLRELEEKFWPAYNAGYIDDIPGTSRQAWDDLYELIYMSAGDQPSPEDKKYGLLDETGLRKHLQALRPQLGPQQTK
jgi:hypothetical protein